MGTSNGRQSFIKGAEEKAEKLGEKRKNLENNIIMEQVNKRQMIDSLDEKGKIRDNPNKNIKFDLNIIIYSYENISKQLMNSLQNYNKEIFNWQIKIFIGFTQENTNQILNIYNNDFKEKNSKMY